MACCAAAAYVVFRFLRMHERLLCGLSGPSDAAPDDDEPWASPPRPAVRATTQPPGDACVLGLGGLTCAACVADVQRVLAAVPGVRHVSVSLALLRARVVYAAPASAPALVDAVCAAGFEAQLPPADAADADANSWAAVLPVMQASAAVRAGEVAQWRRAFGLSAGASMALALSTLLAPLGRGLAVAVSLVAGWPLHRETARALWHGRRPNMSTLGSLGILAALLQTAVGEHTAGDVIPMLSTAVLGGRLLKAVLSRRSLDLGSPLTRLLPAVASVLAADDTTIDAVPIDLVAPGDRLLLRSGDSVPCDGVVDSADRASVCETWMSGSDMPRVVGRSDAVFAGSTVAQGGFRLRAQACGRATRLGQMLESVVQAELDAAEQPAAGFSLHFSSAVLLLTAIVCSIHCWRDPDSGWASVLGRASAMLLAACPCALSLSVPTVKLLATARAAKVGVRLSTRYRRMQDAAAAGVVLFDKTGTLTGGVLQVAHVVEDDSWDARVWQVIRALEADVEHPAALAIVREAEQQIQCLDSGPGTTDTARVTAASHDIGRGVRGTVVLSASADTPAWSGTVAIGSRSYMESLGIRTSLAAVPAEWRTAVATPVLVAVDGVQAGILLLQDCIRPDATATVAELRHCGLRVGMVTGDSHAPATAVARQVGIDSAMVFAGCLPRDKARIVSQFRRQTPTVFVGDNLNDIPSFAAASFGICVGHRSSAGVDVADATLTADAADVNTLRRVLFLLRLLRQARRIVSQNLAWALVYNAAALVYTSGAWRKHPSS